MSRNFLHEHRYVIAIDGQRKASYVDRNSALAEAKKVQSAHPRVKVVVHDQEDGSEIQLSEKDQNLNSAVPDLQL